MKTTLAFLFLGLAALSANAQWQPAARLTNSLGNSTTYANSNRCIAASGNAVHAVWNDMRNGDNDIFYKRSLDGGVTWEADVALVTNTEFQNLPSIAVSGSTVHLVWEDTRDGGSEIYYKRSNDAGVNWTDDTKISLQGSNLGMPSIASEGDNVHAVWLETSASFVEDVYHIASVDGGVTWGMETALSTQESDEVQPTVAVSGNFVHVA
ncbi:MAG TPA: sialidase family protein, partial [Chitinophagales bacterium]|nr:sialidase family protein [Chitinophagales bacterium]